MTRESGKKPQIQVIDRAVVLLNCLAEAEEPLTLRQLADQSGLHPSTAFRILASLAQHDLVEHGVTGYALGVRLAQLGGRVRGQLDLRREARPLLEWLRDQLDETANLIVQEGDFVAYVEHATPTQRMMRVEQLIGSRAPLHVTAVGKLFLGQLGADGCLEYAERTGLKPRTPQSIRDPLVLWQQVKQAMKQGYALDNEEAELGVGCIGVPVRDSSQRIVAGLSISTLISRRQEAWIELLQQAGKRLSTRLGFRE